MPYKSLHMDCALITKDNNSDSRERLHLNKYTE